MARKAHENNVVANRGQLPFGLKPGVIPEAIDYVYEVLDRIDATLIDAGSDRLSQLVELANLSAIVGNLFRAGITRASKGAFKANRPHTYPDLLGVREGCRDIEIKVALENNKPKGHLVKPGPHITIRYVLTNADGTFVRGKSNRGNVVGIWEIRVGALTKKHFGFSNTKGDSGKTAVINAKGMEALALVFCDLKFSPLSPKGRAYQAALVALS
jgi:hypothetical protein